MGKRIEGVDILRMLAMLLVMYQHANGPYSLYILAFHMPVFFIITGFTFTLSDSWKYIKVKDFIIKRAKVILIANYSFILLNIILNALISTFTTQQFSISFKTLLLLGGNDQGLLPMTFWFLPILFFADVFFLLALKNMGNVTYFTITSLLFSYILTKCAPFSTYLVSSNLSKIFMGTFFIGVGYLLSKPIRQLISGAYKPITNIVVAFVSAIILVVFCNLNYSPFYMFMNSYGNYVYASIAALGGSTLLISLVRFVPKITFVNNLLSWGGRNTLSLFPIHVTYLAVIVFIEAKFNFQIPLLWLFNLTILSVLTFVTAKIIEDHFPFMIGKKILK